MLIAHPADKVETFTDKDGKEQQRPFWSLPKRLPSPMDFSADDSTHLDYVVSYAVLLYRLWRLPEEGLPTTTADKNAAAAKVTSVMEPLPFSGKGARQIRWIQTIL